MARAVGVKQLVDLAKFRAFAQCLHRADIFSSFGFAFATSAASSPPIVVAYTLFTEALWPPVEWIHTLFGKFHSRLIEHEADAFAVQHGMAEPLQRGLVSLTLANRMELNVDPLYHAFRHSHPTLVHRVNKIASAQKKLE